MSIVKSSGGVEKVTIDGEKVREKTDLKTSSSLEWLPNTASSYTTPPSGGFYHEKLDAFFIKNDTGETLQYKDGSDTAWKKGLTLPSTELYMGSFIRNEECYIVSTPGRICKISDDGTSYTQRVVSDCPTKFSGTGNAIYLKDKDEVYLSDGNNYGNEKLFKYSFKTSEWTEIALGGNGFMIRSSLVVEKENKIFWLMGDKSINFFDGLNFTNIQNALPNQIETHSFNMASVLKNKIHLITVGVDGMWGSFHFVEGKSLSDWNRQANIRPNPFSARARFSLTNNKEGVIAIFGQQLNSEYGICYKIKESYMEV